jgi:hypothetical protein
MIITLNWVLFRENKIWVAQALAHDICVQARYPGLLGKRMRANVDCYSQQELLKIPPAPQKFHDMFQSVMYIRKQTKHTPWE